MTRQMENVQRAVRRRRNFVENLIR